MKYFAYGSNMSPQRLGNRIASARKIGVFRLDGHDLRFHKKSTDRSAKCGACSTGNDEDFVLGVLYEISNDDKAKLDECEGLGNGYDDRMVSVHSDGRTHKATTYIATNIDGNLMPYSWYVRHVLEGAKAAGFPDDYIDKIKNVRSQRDDDSKREKKELSIYGAI